MGKARCGVVSNSAAVVGAGIAGLAAANALHKSGWQVQVFEQAPAFAEDGAGLVLLPNGFAALDAIGLGDAVRAAGSPFAFGAGSSRPRTVAGQQLWTGFRVCTPD